MSKHTEWDLYRAAITEKVNLRVRLKTKSDVDQATNGFIDSLKYAATLATPIRPTVKNKERLYPAEVCQLVNLRRTARKTWQNTRLPIDKRRFNQLS